MNTPDLVERARRNATWRNAQWHCITDPHLLTDMADALEQQAAENEALRRHAAVRKIEGMPHRSLHGLRYAAAGMLEDAGCTMVEISSIIGHRTYQMAMKYARQRKDAEAAIRRIEQQA